MLTVTILPHSSFMLFKKGHCEHGKCLTGRKHLKALWLAKEYFSHSTCNFLCNSFSKVLSNMIACIYKDSLNKLPFQVFLKFSWTDLANVCNAGIRLHCNFIFNLHVLSTFSFCSLNSFAQDVKFISLFILLFLKKQFAFDFVPAQLSWCCLYVTTF